MENIPLSIYFKDKEGRLIKISKFKEQTDLGKETIGKTDFDLYPEEAARRYIANDKHVMETKQPIINREEAPIVGADGVLRHFLTTKAPVLDDEGNVTGIVGITTDITKLKETEKALEQERTLLRTLIDLLPGPIYAKDRECRKILANRADLHNMGLKTEAEALGKTDFDIYPKEIAEKFYADDQAIIQTGQPVIGREEVNIVNGEPRYFLTSKVPLRDPTGQVVGLVGIGIDITDHKRAEEQRIEAEKEAAAKRVAAEAVAKIAATTSEMAQKYKGMIDELKRAQEELTKDSNMLQNLLDSTHIFIYFKDREGRYVRASKSYQAVHPEGMVGKTDFDLYPDDQAKKSAEEEKRVMETREPIFKEERLVAADGSEIHLLATKAPLLDKEGNVVGIVGVANKISK
jgi:PAS domain S-box-containing protein